MSEELNEALKLSDKETSRIRDFKKQNEELIHAGYSRTDLTISVMKANTTGALTTLPIAAIFILLFIVFKSRFSINSDTLEFILFPVFTIIGILIHEGLHGLTWGLLSGKKFKDIEFGLIVKDLTPYCYCRSSLSKFKYMLGLLMPLIIVGIGLTTLSFVLGNFLLFLTGIVMIFGTSGDVLIALLILKNKPVKRNVLYCDHPIECGVVMYEK